VASFDATAWVICVSAGARLHNDGAASVTFWTGCNLKSL